MLLLVSAALFGVCLTWPADGQTCLPRSHASVPIGTFGTISAYAVDSGALQAFEDAARLENQQMSDLYRSRGLMSQYYGGRPVAAISKITAAFHQSQMDAHAIPVGILFYSYSPAHDTLSAFLLTQCGIEAYARQSAVRARLEATMMAIRESMDIQAHQRERGFPVQQTLLPGMSDNLDEETLALSSILFPSGFAVPMERLSYLVIVPALDIGTVPFAMLRPFEDGDYFSDRVSFSVSASLWDAYQWLRKIDLSRRPFARGKLEASETIRPALIVGNPAFSPALHLPPLPGAEAEAQAIASMLHGRLLVGSDATKTAVVSLGSNSAILYLATHGIADEEDPMHGSFLVLAGPDGRWTANEIQFTHFKDSLVVLSACQTGLGKASDAGVMGIARSFQLSGADVVMSLWSIDDTATTDLMELFVSNLSRETHADALRDAMIQARKKHRDPSRWASFSVFGNPF